MPYKDVYFESSNLKCGHPRTSKLVCCALLALLSGGNRDGRHALSQYSCLAPQQAKSFHTMHNHTNKPIFIDKKRLPMVLLKSFDCPLRCKSVFVTEGWPAGSAGEEVKWQAWICRCEVLSVRRNFCMKKMKSCIIAKRAQCVELGCGMLRDKIPSLNFLQSWNNHKHLSSTGLHIQAWRISPIFFFIKCPCLA